MVLDKGRQLRLQFRVVFRGLGIEQGLRSIDGYWSEGREAQSINISKRTPLHPPTPPPTPTAAHTNRPPLYTLTDPNPLPGHTHRPLSPSATPSPRPCVHTGISHNPWPRPNTVCLLPVHKSNPKGG